MPPMVVFGAMKPGSIRLELHARDTDKPDRTIHHRTIRTERAAADREPHSCANVQIDKRAKVSEGVKLDASERAHREPYSVDMSQSRRVTALTLATVHRALHVVTACFPLFYERRSRTWSFTASEPGYRLLHG